MFSPMYTITEIQKLIHTLKWWLADHNHIHMAQEYEDVETRIRCDKLTALQCKEYADFILPRNRQGRVRLVLSHPVEARAIAVLSALLRSVKE